MRSRWRLVAEQWSTLTLLPARRERSGPRPHQTVFGEILTLLIALEFNHTLHQRDLLPSRGWMDKLFS
jgi:hypothetical protein